MGDLPEAEFGSSMFTTSALTNSSIPFSNLTPAQVPTYARKTWIATQVLVNLCTLAFIYLLARLVKDELRHVTHQFEGSKGRTRKVMGARLHRVCIGAAVFDLLFVATAQFYLFTAGGSSSKLCEVTIFLSSFVYSGALLCTFTFLWWRQRALYANPMLRHLSTKCSKVISWVSIVGFTTTFAVPTFGQLVWRRYIATPEGCELEPRLIPTFKVWYIMYTVGYFSNQLLLLWLYVHPLLVHKKRKESLDNAKRKSSGASSNEVNTAPKPDKKEKKFRQCIFRSVVIATCCILNDVVAASGVMYVSRINRDRWMMLIPHHINLLINLICMILCFVYWRDILIPCCSKEKKNTQEPVDDSEYSFRTSDTTRLSKGQINKV